MQDKHLCHKCGMRFRHEIRMYDPNALYLDTKSPDLLIKTERERPVGCFYCFPVRRVAKGFLYLGHHEVKQEVQMAASKAVAPDKSGRRPWSEAKIKKTKDDRTTTE